MESIVSTYFNPRSREGNDAKIRDFSTLHLQVSIHVPAKGTTVCLALTVCRLRVSIHVPAKGTTVRGDADGSGEAVSIHVPAKGTTVCLALTVCRLRVSIHVPAKGTTWLLF